MPKEKASNPNMNDKTKFLILKLLADKKTLTEIAEEAKLSSKEVDDWIKSEGKKIASAIDKFLTTKEKATTKQPHKLDRFIGKNKVAFISQATSEAGDASLRNKKKPENKSYLRPLTGE